MLHLNNLIIFFHNVWSHFDLRNYTFPLTVPYITFFLAMSRRRKGPRWVLFLSTHHFFSPFFPSTCWRRMSNCCSAAALLSSSTSTVNFKLDYSVQQQLLIGSVLNFILSFCSSLSVLYIVPSQPHNVSFREVTNSSVVVRWNEPKFPNGIIQGYRLYYMHKNYTDVQTVREPAQKMEFLLTGLGE